MATEEQGKTLFVENLNPYVSEARVQDIFREFGQVSNVRLLRDKGLNAGAAYVTYKDRASAQQALQASNGQEICGKARHAVPAVRVGWAPDEGLSAAQQGRTAPEQGPGWAVPDAAPLPAQRALGLLAAAAVETAGAAAHAAPVPASGQPHQGGPQPQRQPQASAVDVPQPAPAPAPAAVQPAGAALDAQRPCAPADAAALLGLSAAAASQAHLRPQPQAALQDPGLRVQLPPPLPPPPAAPEQPPAAGSATLFSPARVHIFVGNLPPEAGDGALLDAFHAGGAAAADARVLRDHGTGRSKGFGFVGFPSQESAVQAIALMHGAFLGQSRLRCSWAAQKPELAVCDAQAAKVHASTPANTNVYVGNLPVEVDEAQLVGHFALFGPVVGVKLCLKGGFGFVHFREHGDAVAAICAMNGRPIAGKPAKVAWGRAAGAPGGGGCGGAGGAKPPPAHYAGRPDLGALRNAQLAAAAAAAQEGLQAMAALRLGAVGGLGGAAGGLGGAQGVLPAVSGPGLGLMPFAGAAAHAQQYAMARARGLFEHAAAARLAPAYGGQAGGAHPWFAPALYAASGSPAAAAGLGGAGQGGAGAKLGAGPARPLGLGGAGLCFPPASAAPGGASAGAYAALQMYKAGLAAGGRSAQPNGSPAAQPAQGFSLAAVYGEIGQKRALDAAARAAGLGLLPVGAGFAGAEFGRGPGPYQARTFGTKQKFLV